jgi:hypothetical protein
MPQAKEVHFRINAYTPGTIPMDRLALYMREFARLLGEPASVHFDKLIEGSACIVAWIDAAVWAGGTATGRETGFWTGSPSPDSNRSTIGRWATSCAISGWSRGGRGCMEGGG